MICAMRTFHSRERLMETESAIGDFGERPQAWR